MPLKLYWLTAVLLLNTLIQGYPVITLMKSLLSLVKGFRFQDRGARELNPDTAVLKLETIYP